MPGDQPPPLVVVPQENNEPEPTKIVRRRKRRRAKNHADTEWESLPSSGTAHGKDRGAMIWQLVLGTALFSALIVWIATSLDAEKPAPLVIQNIAEEKAEEKAEDERVVEEPSTWYDPEKLDGLCRAFLSASTVDALLPIVRHRERLEPAIRDYHARNPLEAPGLSSFSVVRQADSEKWKVVTLSVQTGRYQHMLLNVCDTPDGMKIDWESWVGYSERPWGRIMDEKPASPVLLRAVLSRSDYFNMDFSDETRWRCYRLVSADGEQLIYGYLDASSPEQREYIERIDRIGLAEFRITLKIRYPDGAKSNNQAMIAELVSEGWLLADTKP